MERTRAIWLWRISSKAKGRATHDGEVGQSSQHSLREALRNRDQGVLSDSSTAEPRHCLVLPRRRDASSLWRTKRFGASGGAGSATAGENPDARVVQFAAKHVF